MRRSRFQARQSILQNNIQYRVDTNEVQGKGALQGLGNISVQPKYNAKGISIMAKIDKFSTTEEESIRSRLSGVIDSIPILRRSSMSKRLSEVTPATPTSLSALSESGISDGSGSDSKPQAGYTMKGKRRKAHGKRSSTGYLMNSKSGSSYLPGASEAVGDKKVHKFAIVHEVSTQEYKWVLDCDSKLRRYWDVLIVLLVIYLCFTVPLSIAFVEMNFNKGFATLADIVFYTDMVLNFRTSFIHHGCNIRDPREIAKHYVESGWLAVDVLASIPFELILEGGFDKSARKSIKILKWLKIPKLLRIGKVLRYLKGYVKYYRLFILLAVTVFSCHMLGCLFLSLTDSCETLECSDSEMWNYYYLSLRMSYLLVFQVSDPFQFVAHIDRGIYQKLTNGTFYQNLGSSASVMEESDGSGRLLLDASITASDSYTQTFSHSTGLPHFYSSDAWSEWTFFSDKRQLQVYGLQLMSWLGMSLGFWLTVNFVAEAVNFTSNRMSSYNRFFNKVADMQREMRRLSIPMETQYRVKRYYDYLWINGMFALNKKGGGILGDKDLSKALRKELALQIHGPLLSSISIFTNATDDYLFGVAMRLKILVFLPGDTVFEKGDVAHELYIIKKGIIAVNFGEIDAFEASKADGLKKRIGSNLESDQDDEYETAKEFEDSATLNLMGPGCFFGEIALLTTMPRSCSVYSKTVSELHELSKQDFDDVMDEHPQLLDEFRRNVLMMYPGLREKVEEGVHDSEEHLKSKEAPARESSQSKVSFKATLSKSKTEHINVPMPSPAVAGGVSEKQVQRMINKAVDEILKAVRQSGTSEDNT